MSKMIKLVVDDDTHARLVAKAKSLGMLREQFYKQIMEKASRKR